MRLARRHRYSIIAFVGHSLAVVGLTTLTELSGNYWYKSIALGRVLDAPVYRLVEWTLNGHYRFWNSIELPTWIGVGTYVTLLDVLFFGLYGGLFWAFVAYCLDWSLGRNKSRPPTPIGSHNS